MKYLFLILLLPAMSSHADIFQCKDEYGKLIFKDSECNSSNNVIRPDLRDNASTSETKAVTKTPVDSVLENGKPGKRIFFNNKRLSSPYRLKVNEVRLISETKDTLVLDVIYNYKHRIPANEMRLFVVPNHGYWSVNHLQVEQGINVGRVSIGLSRSNMKKKRVTRSSTDTITVRFEHYPPDNTYKGVIWSETIKYKKKWELKK